MQKTSRDLRSRRTSTLPFSPKDRIDHDAFGLGIILSINERYTEIAFDESGTRKFVTSMVKLAPSNTPAPAGKAAKRKTVRRSR